MENQFQIFLHGRCAFPWEVWLMSLGMGFRTTDSPENDFRLLQHRCSCTGNPTGYGQQVAIRRKLTPAPARIRSKSPASLVSIMPVPEKYLLQKLITS